MLMALYGIKICLPCYGYGIELRAAEIVKIKTAMWHKRTPPGVQRLESEVIQCSNCKGAGWVMAAGCRNLTLPAHTFKRW